MAQEEIGRRILTCHAQLLEFALEFLEVRPGQLHLYGRVVFLQVVALACAGNWHNEGLLVEEPGERYLTRCCAFALTNPSQDFNQRAICSDGLLRPPGKLRARSHVLRIK